MEEDIWRDEIIGYLFVVTGLVLSIYPVVGYDISYTGIYTWVVGGFILIYLGKILDTVKDIHNRTEADTQ